MIVFVGLHVFLFHILVLNIIGEPEARPLHIGLAEKFHGRSGHHECRGRAVRLKILLELNHRLRRIRPSVIHGRLLRNAGAPVNEGATQACDRYAVRDPQFQGRSETRGAFPVL